MGTPFPLHKRGRSPQIFGRCLLWPNGWVDEAGTWHGGTWGPSPLPQRGPEFPPQYLAHFYCGQTAGCIRMPLGMDVGLSPGDFVLDGDPFPLQGRGAPPIFGPCLLWPNGWMDQDAKMGGTLPNFRPTSVVAKRLLGSWCHFHTEVGLGIRDIVFDVDPATPRKKVHTHPTKFLAHVYCGQMVRWMKTPLGTEVDCGSCHIVHSEP